MSFSSSPVCVCIIGGSFAGLTCARELLKDQRIQVTLLEPKDYFEYTPGILRAMVQPHILTQLCIEREQLAINSSTRFTHKRDIAAHIENTQVITTQGEKIHYDYCVLATGSGYPLHIKPVWKQETQSDVHSLSCRLQSMLFTSDLIVASSCITIIGAGYVGVELAAELADTFCGSKPVRLLCSPSGVLSSLPAGASQYAQQWLTQRNVRIQVNAEKTVQQILSSADVGELVFDCTGLQPLPLPSFLSGSFVTTPRGITVNSSLQLVSQPNVYVVGDISACPVSSLEPKLAYTAELQATIAANNIRRSLVASLTASSSHVGYSSYPSDLSVFGPPPLLVCCSLGRWSGILCFNSLYVTGIVAAIAKQVIQRTKIEQYKGNKATHLLWKVTKDIATITTTETQHSENSLSLSLSCAGVCVLGC